MKSKLFLSLSLLTAVFSMNANSNAISRFVVHPKVGHVYKSTIRDFSQAVSAKTSTLTNPFVQMGALCAATASTVAGSLYGASQYQNGQDVAAKAAQVADRKARAYLKEAELKEQAAYIQLGLNDANNTRFAQFKAQLNNGLSIAKNYKKTSAVAGTVVVAGLGYMGYKKLAAKYAQAKTVTTPVVNTPVVETPVVKKALVAKKAVKKSTSSRRNNCNRRK
ncbi:hypothetical protein KBD08_03535 [Candidatus Babeliales bacterium]|nr:hypothetical protein [Candidatus Babeliales bacterium]